MGDGSKTDRHTPIKILDSGVAKVAAGDWHNLILKTDGSLLSTGYNRWGQVGDGVTDSYESGVTTPTQVMNSGVVAQIAAGAYHSLILKTDGSLHTFGKNTKGQLGLGSFSVEGLPAGYNPPTKILPAGSITV